MMEEVLCVCAMLITLLLPLVAGQSCVPQCFGYEYGACSTEELSKMHIGDPLPFHVTLADPGGGREAWQEPFHQALLSLLCKKLQPTHLAGPNLTAPLCVVTVNATSEACGIENCGCVGVDLMVFERASRKRVSSWLVNSKLDTDCSKLALQMAGFYVLQVYTNEMLNLFDVPTVSWILVGLGVVMAVFVLAMPFWWDRCLSKRCRKKDEQKKDLLLPEPSSSSKTTSL